jgi:two-component system LytT family response regulator
MAIDDEPLALRQLVTYISKVPFLQLVAQCQSAVEAREFLNNDTADAMFCDINMPDFNGMDFVKSLAAPPLVVFTTAYADYAVEGYKVDAVDYLLKPFSLDEFRRAAMRLQKRLSAQTAKPQAPQPAPEEAPAQTALPPQAQQAATPTAQAEPAKKPTEDKEFDTASIFVKTDGRIVKVAVDNIVYVEGMSEYLKIHLDKNPQDGRPQKPLIVLYSMKRIEERLPNYFMRIHRSYIVNLRKVQEVNKNRVIMDKDTYLPIGELYKEAFNAFLSKNFLGK